MRTLVTVDLMGHVLHLTLNLYQKVDGSHTEPAVRVDGVELAPPDAHVDLEQKGSLNEGILFGPTIDPTQAPTHAGGLSFDGMSAPTERPPAPPQSEFTAGDIDSIISNTYTKRIDEPNQLIDPKEYIVIGGVDDGIVLKLNNSESGYTFSQLEEGDQSFNSLTEEDQLEKVLEFPDSNEFSKYMRDNFQESDEEV